MTASFATPQYSPIKTAGSHMRLAYHLDTVLTVPESEVWGNILAASEVILNWISEKISRTIPAEAYKGQDFLMDFPGNRLEAASIPEEFIWALRLEHPDAPLDDCAAVPGRIWHSSFSLSRVEDGIRCAIQILCVTTGAPGPDPRYLRPRIAADLAARFELKADGFPIGRVIDVKTPAEAATIGLLLRDSQRTLPLLVLSAAKDGNFLIAPEELEKFTACCHRIRIFPSASFAWREEVAPFHAYNGTVRLYHPGFNAETDQSGQHPFVMADKISFWPGGAAKFAQAYRETVLRRHARLSRAAVAPYLSEVRTRVRRRLLEGLSALGSSPDVAIELELAKIDIDELKIQTIRMQEELDSTSELLEYSESESVQYKRDLYNLRQRLSVLENVLRMQNEAIPQEPEPETTAEIIDWADKELAGKLILHARARRGLKGTVYDDASMIVSALRFLAGTYRDNRLGKIPKEERDAALSALGMEESPSISDPAAGRLGQEYYVDYEERSRKLDMHLKKGVSRDKRECLRIYFFWDDATSQIVVGSLPEHLETRGS